MNISDEAIVAALDSYDPSWSNVAGDWDQYFKMRMSAALEAAAPYMTATRPGKLD